MYKVWHKPDVALGSIKDSMELESNQTIATVTDKFGITASLEVCGEVRVIWCGEIFFSYADFPNELKELIRTNPYWEDDERVIVINNNWFEIYTEAPNCFRMDVCVVDLKQFTERKIDNLLAEALRRNKKTYLGFWEFKKAIVYAKASIQYFKSGNVRLAAKYGNKIYNLRNMKHYRAEALFQIMHMFSDEAVYTITDFLKKQYYQYL